MKTTEITDEAELLTLLREGPTLRAVCYPDDESPAVCECKNGNPAAPSRVVAWIADKGSASDLLSRAQDADCAEDAAAWQSLPLRYGPFCSTWVLPEHPAAPSKPGADGK